MSGTILDRIVADRRARIDRLGHAQGETLPEAGPPVPVPFDRDPFVICEIKRRSPSRGAISAAADPVLQAAKYVSRGVQSISVLTEPEYFGGSLQDLIRVKQQYPQVAVLRKDFLLDVEDIEVSRQAGADAVLLIAAILAPQQLARMHARALELGMQALVELHSRDELEAVRALQPALVGVNSRDLRSFTMDALVPLRLRAYGDWQARWVFESGVFEEEHAALAAEYGFDGVLVGEAVMHRPQRITGIQQGLQRQPGDQVFWSRIAADTGEMPAAAAPEREASSRRPLIKICGLTWQEDVRLADQAGADLLGFVFADSPRRADPAMVARLGATRALKVGVVVTSPGQGKTVPDQVLQLLQDGHLDALQFSGDEAPDECYPQAFPYYKAVRLGSEDDLELIRRYRCPRVLIDARAPGGEYGGSGHRIPAELVAAAGRPLWLAGGLNPENVAAAVREFRPELVDVSSGLESHPGKKDPRKIRDFIQEVINETA
ncbi:bifunctional indole-3-glycerol phosphate synthase/phosphoribosylanthranilate isomerase [Spirochaeta africana]|uniref:N-(5'-phosphoribosyl)anthranilate isomerase n=1 Tax=Spirochaeta africana (strain ATCC 700263 / DSM 8902 / Z-7692) TaxID=889378 RepID=H9UM36_SPIAZ|nr:bifunctional indole-3-glycerol phosphate synthase/phosphoribosylanthranilate isomerase [Spirochaeta africana]AFG38579.1 Indole-3-glycerol phosphate synthase [Spirochaeta africana DSM 8902]